MSNVVWQVVSGMPETINLPDYITAEQVLGTKEWKNALVWVKDWW